ncbi:hypothetical protein FJ251_13910 [bacterium]|nr:hypothetical protein [bacterium]
MATPSELRDLETRSQRYWTLDGIPERVMGLVWLLWSAALIAEDALPRSAWGGVLTMAIPAVLVVSGVGANWLIRRLKERLSYPRTGYVGYPEPSRRQRLLAAGVACLAALSLATLILTGRAEGMERVISPAIGLVISLAFLVLSLRQRAPHLLALAGVALALGIGIGMLKLGWRSLNWLFIGLGAASVALGLWRLRRYLAAHPRETQA